MVHWELAIYGLKGLSKDFSQQQQIYCPTHPETLFFLIYPTPEQYKLNRRQSWVAEKYKPIRTKSWIHKAKNSVPAASASV